MPSPTVAPTVSSTVGLKNLVIAPVTADTEESTTYGDLQKVAGAIEATITPENNDPDVQYFDDTEGDVLYPDPELSFTTRLADLPLVIQEMIFGNQIDDNGNSPIRFCISARRFFFCDNSRFLCRISESIIIRTNSSS